MEQMTTDELKELVKRLKDKMNIHYNRYENIIEVNNNSYNPFVNNQNYYNNHNNNPIGVSMNN